MTIDRRCTFAKFFFLIVFALGVYSLESAAAETIEYWPKIRALKQQDFQSLYTTKILQKRKAKAYKKVNMAKISKTELKRMKRRIKRFKKHNPNWRGGDALLKKLNTSKERKVLQQEYRQLLIKMFSKSLDRDPDEYIELYYVIPRIVIEFRERLSEKLAALGPQVAVEIQQRLDRDVFEDKGEPPPEAFLSQLEQRFRMSFGMADLKEKTILGEVASPGETYYAQSYMVRANFTPFDRPYNLTSSAMFNFFAQTEPYKRPFGILVRDLKRIFLRKDDAAREQIQERLHNLYDSLDESAKVLMVQHWIQVDKLSQSAFLSFWGLGWPVYVGQGGEIQFKRQDQPIYPDGTLLSPELYRNEFIKENGDPRKYHSDKDLPRMKNQPKSPVYVVMYKFDPAADPLYVTYDFPGRDMSEYDRELDEIIDTVIAVLTGQGSVPLTPTPPAENQGEGDVTADPALTTPPGSGGLAPTGDPQIISDISAPSPASPTTGTTEADLRRSQLVDQPDGTPKGQTPSPNQPSGQPSPQSSLQEKAVDSAGNLIQEIIGAVGGSLGN